MSIAGSIKSFWGDLSDTATAAVKLIGHRLSSVRKGWLASFMNGSPLLDAAHLTEDQKLILAGQGDNVGFMESRHPFVKTLMVNICMERNAEKTARTIMRAVLRSKTGEKQKIEEGDATYKMLFERPNDQDTPTGLLEHMILQYYIYGTSYTLFMGTKRTPISLEPLFTPDVLPNYNENQTRVLSYDATNVVGNIPLENMLCIKAMNPFSRTEGISSLYPLSEEIDLLNLINEWQHRGYHQGVTPNMAFLLEKDELASPITEEEDNRLRKEIKRKYTGPSGETFFLLDGVSKIEKLDLSPADLDMIQSERYTASMIAAKYRFPPELIGGIVDKKNYANFKEASRAWVADAIFPLAKKYIDGLNWFFYSGTNRELYLDETMVHELRPTAEELRDTPLTINEKRQKMGMPPVDEENADKILIDGGRVLLSDLSAVEDEENL